MGEPAKEEIQIGMKFGWQSETEHFHNRRSIFLFIQQDALEVIARANMPFDA
jgi:hypothetical protein